MLEKRENMDFCSAKKPTKQGFVMKNVDTANFCSLKKRTLQSLKGTPISLVSQSPRVDTHSAVLSLEKA